ncbi:MAG: hypothetical protein L6Q81_13415 [Bacteroidia bacterium]|nr:hypothetical protein [Bacteroidia bacterium]
MKNIFRILPLVFAVVFASCTKEEIAPLTPGVPSMVHVEYRVHANSGRMTVHQLVPSQGVLAEEKVEINRSEYSYEFDVLQGTFVSVTGTNSMPGPDEVITEIYVNDVLLATGSANAPGAVAKAEGIAR